MALVGRLRDALGSRSGAGLLGRVAGKVREELRDRKEAEPTGPLRALPTTPLALPTTPLTGPLAPKPAQPPKEGGLAAAARRASEHGVSSATTFRAQQQEAPAEEEEHVDAPPTGPLPARATGPLPPRPTGPLSTRDIVIGEEQHDTIVRTAADGARYLGPTDNDSARAKAAGHRLDIDRNECIGCGTCVEHIDTVFWLNGDEGKAYVLVQDGAMDHIQDAIDACPVTCISWQET